MIMGNDLHTRNTTNPSIIIIGDRLLGYHEGQRVGPYESTDIEVNITARDGHDTLFDHPTRSNRIHRTGFVPHKTCPWVNKTWPRKGGNQIVH